MTASLHVPSTAETRAEISDSYDVVIVGAGISGMYQLIRLRELGLNVRVFEAGDGVGGTWYWNRYPGARFDSESWTYSLSFSDELLQEWDWKEHFSAQPETLKYCNYVADKFDLRKDITFEMRVKSARFDETARQWEVLFENGQKVRCRFLITAIGPISTPTLPAIPGVDDFKGEAYLTGLWPHHPVSFEGKRVAVIGTGATGVQTITEVAKTVGHLTVYQRTPNWCAPLNNSPVTDEEQARIKANIHQIMDKCRDSYGGFIHDADPRNALDVSEEEREAFYEELYNGPGFGIWMGNFRDVLIDEAANATITDFVTRKIRQRVKDQDLATKLIPTNHGFGTRRVPLESGYYEVYNQDNVDLVDLRESPIEQITEKGIVTAEGEREFDMIIFATGFDAITGAFDKIEIIGKDGQKLKDKWADGPETFLGMMVSGFPNMLTLVGPHNAATFCNMPRCIEQNVDWVTNLLKYALDRDLSYIEASAEAEDGWTEHVFDTSARLLAMKVDSWITGINKNVPGRQKRVSMVYAGGAHKYREKCNEVAAHQYEGIDFA